MAYQRPNTPSNFDLPNSPTCCEPQTEVAAIFRELSAGLSEKQRVAFLLREIEGLSSPEVAEVLGCRESTVRNHLFNARKYLRRELLKRYPEYAGGFGAEDDGKEVAL